MGIEEEEKRCKNRTLRDTNRKRERGEVGALRGDTKSSIRQIEGKPDQDRMTEVKNKEETKKEGVA